MNYFIGTPKVFYTYLIVRLVSSEGLLWLELREQDNFLVFYSSRILHNTVINLHKGRKTFSKKIPGSYKYCKIAFYVLKYTRIFRVFGKQSERNKGGILPLQQFSIFGNQNFINIKC